MNAVKPKIMHQVPDAVRYYDGLPRGNSPQGSPIQVVEMGVRHEHKVDRGKMLQRKPWTTNTFDDFQPERPDRIDQDVASPPLNQKGSVPDPSQANIVRRKRWKLRLMCYSLSTREKGGQIDLRNEIALEPSLAGLQAYAILTIPGKLGHNPLVMIQSFENGKLRIIFL
jgi:hypothetical protein